MEDFNDLKAIWEQATPRRTTDAATIIRMAGQHRRATAWRTIACILALVGTLVVFAMVYTSYDFRFATTGLGIFLAAIAVIGGIVVNTQIAWLMIKPDNSSDNKTYLATMQKLQQKEEYTYRKGLSLYFIFLFAGMMLYLYEFTYGGLMFSLIIYGTTTTWFLIAWFYLRPRTIRKRKKKTQAIIDHLHAIERQMKEE